MFREVNGMNIIAAYATIRRPSNCRVHRLMLVALTVILLSLSFLISVGATVDQGMPSMRPPGLDSTPVECSLPTSIRVPLAARLTNIAADPNRPYIYVGDEDDDMVLVISVTTGEVVNSIPVGIEPRSIDINPVSDTLFVASHGSGRVDVIDLATQTLTGSMTLSHVPERLIVGQPGRLYAVSWGNTHPTGKSALIVVDTDAQNEIGYSYLPFELENPSVLAISGDGRSLFLGREGSPSDVGKYDVTSDSPVYTWSCGAGGGNSMDLAASADGTRLYVANASPPYIRVLDTVDCSEIGQLNTGPGASAVELDSTEDIVYAANNSEQVFVFDALDLYLERSFTIDSGLGPLIEVKRITAAPDQRRLFLIEGYWDSDEDVWIIIPDPSESRKSVNTDLGEAGQVLTYTIAITNTTIDMVDPMFITDKIPPSVTFVPGTLSGGPVYISQTNTISWTGYVAGGASSVFQFQVEVRDPISEGETIRNTVWISHPLMLSPLEKYTTVVVPGQADASASSAPPRFLRLWGSQGTGDGQFGSYPYGVAVDATGNVYVSDRGNDRIQKFDRQGNFLLKWGTSGSEPGQFHGPMGLTTHPDGRVYVADSQNNRVQVFDSNGTFLFEWGTSGTGDGEFDNPNDIAIDPMGNVFVVDFRNHRIQKFDDNGAFIDAWGTLGNCSGQFNWPLGIEVGSDGHVYVTDSQNHRIQVFDSDGNFLLSWGSEGSEEGQFNVPYGVTLDREGNVYVSEFFNHRIQKFSGQGNFITMWGGRGYQPGQFSSPAHLAMDNWNNLFVADSDWWRIQVFTNNIVFCPVMLKSEVD
jgi:uncharacterized repeat protein (TIGR01451 family)